MNLEKPPQKIGIPPFSLTHPANFLARIKCKIDSPREVLCSILFSSELTKTQNRMIFLIGFVVARFRDE